MAKKWEKPMKKAHFWPTKSIYVSLDLFLGSRDTLSPSRTVKSFKVEGHHSKNFCHLQKASITTIPLIVKPHLFCLFGFNILHIKTKENSKFRPLSSKMV